jgi:hypothetical protein
VASAVLEATTVELTTALGLALALVELEAETPRAELKASAAAIRKSEVSNCSI